MPGATARASRMQLVRFSSRIWSHTSSVVSTSVCGRLLPALLNRMSTRAHALQDFAGQPIHVRSIGHVGHDILDAHRKLVADLLPGCLQFVFMGALMTTSAPASA